MATEVTKIITVSLGKIHQSRQTKCGVNLRKSLLVASVLHKARDIYVTEIKNRKADSASLDSEPQSIKKRKFTSQRSLVEAEVCQTEDSASEAPSQVMDESQSSDQTNVQSNLVSDDILDQLASSSEPILDKENNPPKEDEESTVKVEELTSSSCNRCLKRRNGDSESDNIYTVTSPSTNNEPTYVPKKRLRTDSVDHSQSESVPMSTESTQINSLVMIFNNSFDEFKHNTENSQLYDNSNGCNTTSTELNTFALCRDSIALTA